MDMLIIEEICFNRVSNSCQTNSSRCRVTVAFLECGHNSNSSFGLWIYSLFHLIYFKVFSHDYKVYFFSQSTDIPLKLVLVDVEHHPKCLLILSDINKTMLENKAHHMSFELYTSH